MPVSIAHAVRERNKRNPLSEYEKRLAEADDQANLVFACPYGCAAGQVDDHGLCDHMIGFTNARLLDGEVKNPPEGAVVEVLETDRDLLQRRKFSKRKDVLKPGDYLVRVNGTTRRVYRQPEVKDEKAASRDAVAGTDASSNTVKSKSKEAPLG